MRIRQRILTIAPFTEPWEYLAADINRSNSVSTLDMLLLQRVILQIDSSFPNNDPWRFFDQSYNEIDSSNPWSFPEEVPGDEIYFMNSSVLNRNFIVLKVGDVTGDF